MRVRTYLFFIVAAALIPLTLFAAYALNALRDTHRELNLTALQESASKAAMLVDAELSSTAAALIALSRSPQLAQGDLAAFHAHARMADLPTLGRTVLYDSQGKPLLDTLSAFNAPLPSATETTAAMVKRAIETQEPTVQGIYLNALRRAPVTSINVPVSLPDGGHFVLGAIFDHAYFQRLLAQRNVPSPWRSVLIDEHGTTIGRNDGMLDLLGTPASPALINLMVGTANKAEAFNDGGSSYYGALSHSLAAPWTIAVTAPVAAIDSAAIRDVQLFHAALIAVVAFALLASLILALTLKRTLGIVSSASTSDEESRRNVTAPTPPIAQSSVPEKALAQEESAALTPAQALSAQERRSDEQHAFLSVLGHELRNPLNAIMGAAAFLDQSGISPERAAGARTILKRQSMRLSHIVNEMQDLTRLALGKTRVTMQPLNLAQLVQATVASLHARNETQHEFSIQVRPSWVEGDPVQLEKMISQLCAYAIRHAPESSTILVRSWTENERAILSVQHAGVGIKAGDLSHIFEPFAHHADDQRTRVSLELGLAFVKVVANLHSGQVQAHSAGLAEGCSFSIRLPAIQPPTTAINQDAPLNLLVKPHQGPPFDANLASMAPPHPATARARLRVVYVEDLDDARVMIAGKLRARGCEVFEAADGLTGLALCMQVRPDVALLDVALPGIDGYELARRLRAQTATRSMRLIALTAYGRADDRARALEAGFDAHLVKPVGIDALLEAAEQRQELII